MPDPTNLALIGGVFGLLIGSIFSQRARCGLAYLVVPLLSAFALHRVWGTSFDLVEELTFYASYHSDWRNQLVHIVFVPLLVASAMVFLAYVPPLARARPLGLPLNWATLAAAAWSLHFVHAAPLVGSLVAALTFAFAVGATGVVERERAKSGTRAVPSREQQGRAALWAGALHVLGWYMQLHPGHALFEGRKAYRAPSHSSLLSTLQLVSDGSRTLTVRCECPPVEECAREWPNPSAACPPPPPACAARSPLHPSPCSAALPPPSASLCPRPAPTQSVAGTCLGHVRDMSGGRV